MKKLFILLLLLPCFAGAQTFLVSPDGNIPHDSLTMYVTPTQLADSLAGSGGGTDTNALTTNTPMSSTLDTVQRNGVNSALHLSTVGMKMLSNGIGMVYDTAASFRLSNETLSTIGTPEQVSPFLLIEGTGLGGVTSKRLRYGIYTDPAAAGTDPTGDLVFFSQVNNDPISIGMYLNSSKTLTVDSNIIITDGQFKTTGTIAQNIGNWYGIENDNGFTSTGASIFSGYSYHGAINQGGGGSGITRGIYVNAGLTSPADYRAIETTNTLGKSIVTGSAPSTFGGNVTFPTFTLGATAITATGTELNYLSGVTSGIQSQLNAKQSTITFGTGVQAALGVNIGSAGAPVLFNGAGGTPSSMTGTNITGIPQSGVTNLASDLALKAPLASAPLTGTTTATNTTDVTLGAESALRIGGAANSTNMTGGEYSTGTAWQSRNNGAVASMFLNPFGGDLRYGDASVTGGRLFMISNPSAGTGSFAGWEVRNGTTNSGEALVGYTLGTAFTTSGMNVQDAGVLRTGTSLSGGLSIGTQAAADMRFYSNNTLRFTVAASGHTHFANRLEETQATVASANNLTLTTANHFLITGTTQINAITTTDWQAGAVISLQFQGILTVKNNTAGGGGTAVLRLSGAADFVTSALDTLTLKYDGTQWVELARSNN